MTEILTAEREWHALTAANALDLLGTDAGSGLEPVAADVRLTEVGPNAIPRTGTRSAWRRLGSQFSNPLIIVLLVAGLVTVGLGHFLDAIVIFGVVIINAAIGFVQEGRAQSALAAVRQMIPAMAIVVRGGERREIPAADLVPGDIVLLEAGARVPADVRLLRVNSLRVEEAALTGESVPVDKQTAPLAEDAALADRDCMAFSGTQVVNGTARAVVVATGPRTQIGEIGELVQETRSLSTPLTRRMDGLARQVTGSIMALGVIVWGLVVLAYGMDPVEAFMAVVGMAVAAIPEGLPAVITVILAIASRSLARHRAIIRRLPAVETLGSVSVICSDKTGTMTCNEVTVVSVMLADREFSVTGSGYSPDGGLRDGHGDPVEAGGDPDLLGLLVSARLCNDAELHQAEQQWHLTGDPTEGALLTLAAKAGLDLPQTLHDYPRLDEIPFDSGRRYMATLHHDHHGRTFLIVKGAPEQVCELATGQTSQWLQRAQHAAAAGQRVLAFARATLDQGTTSISVEGLPPDLQIIGLVGMQDPPRPETLQAVQDCHRAGISVKMITGDHRRTAENIAEHLDLQVGPGGLEGKAIDEMSDSALQEALNSTDVIARASPANKLRIVQVLQDQGQFVAMTGDGANDAPALKAADIGVAMGGRGTDAARDASDLVLADDNFRTIRDAVKEARIVYDNIKKTLLFMLPTNGGEAALVATALVLGLTMPVTVTQILWVNMVTAVTLAVALAFEPAEPGIMERPPRRQQEPLLTRPLVARIAFVSLLMLTAALAIFEWELARGSSMETARTAATTMLVLGELVYLFNVRHFTKSGLNWAVLRGNNAAIYVSLLLVTLQLCFIYLPPLQTLFNTRPLEWSSWAALIVLTTIKYLAVEAEKAWWRSRDVMTF